MRFYPKNFSSVVSKAKSNLIKGILLYGPDRGMIQHFINLLQRSLGLSIRKIAYSDKSSFLQYVNALSLLASKEIVIFENCHNSLDKDIKQAFAEDMHNFPLLIADDLSTSSSLRQFFEKQENLASIACYSDQKSDLMSIVKSYLADVGKSIEERALEYISQNLNNDRQALYSELDKLIQYIEQPHISLENVQSLIVPSRSFAIDKLCISFINRDAAGYFYELDNLFSANVSEMLIIRSLIKYHVNIHLTRRRISFGASIDEAIAKLTPPIFFMYISHFKAIVQKSKSYQILTTLKNLNLSEIELKSTNKHSRNVFENIFYQRG